MTYQEDLPSLLHQSLSSQWRHSSAWHQYHVCSSAIRTVDVSVAKIERSNFLISAVFNWVSQNHNQSHHSSQSQTTQSENEPIKIRSARGFCKARENVFERVTIGFAFTSDWMKNSRELFSQSCHEVMQNVSTLKWQPLYYKISRGMLACVRSMLLNKNSKEIELSICLMEVSVTK